ncbi:MAG TPA: SDR family oxidoreductase [Bryobacteraceae bacterium]|jgi:NAD(P)-dependent dehydrogenase (short-subunit alcohol dehydrogenase family)
MPDTLKGREVVLAGGAGGIGSAVADLLVGEGARVILSYRHNADRAARFREGAAVLQADLASPEDRATLLDAAPSLYAVVVLAGDPARAVDPSQLESAMQRSHDANYLGPILLAREAADRMKSAVTAGAIVLVSTMQANALFPGSTAYAAQKAALQHAGRILARECRGRTNIRVNVVSPGVTAAGMAEASIASGKYDRFIEEGVIDRFGSAADVARAIRFFLEPDNYITGQVLCVDGGMTL